MGGLDDGYQDVGVNHPQGIHLDEDDFEALRREQATRQFAHAQVVQHLQDYLRRNPNATYTSWLASLHPENVQLDPRLMNEGNTWQVVWEQATADDRLSCPRLCRRRAW